jgi:hypothetical protein
VQTELGRRGHEVGLALPKPPRLMGVLVNRLDPAVQEAHAIALSVTHRQGPRATSRGARRHRLGQGAPSRTEDAVSLRSDHTPHAADPNNSEQS